MRLESITPQIVELAPSPLQDGALYISPKYKVAIHLCACGCGEKVVTPLSAAEWQVDLHGGTVSMSPSIGNWSMACKSHYWIRKGRIVWSGAISKKAMKQVFAQDQQAIALQQSLANAKSPKTGGWLGSFWRWLRGG